MAAKKYYWTTTEICEFLNKYYGTHLHWWQRLGLWWFGVRNKGKTYYLFGDELWGVGGIKI